MQRIAFCHKITLFYLLINIPTLPRFCSEFSRSHGVFIDRIVLRILDASGKGFPFLNLEGNAYVLRLQTYN